MNEKIIDKWYGIQNIIAAICLLIASWYNIGNSRRLCELLILAVVLLFSIFLQSGRFSKIVRRSNFALQSCLQPLALVVAWSTLNAFWASTMKGQISIIFLIIAAIYYAIMFVPFVLKVAGKINGIIMKIMLTIIWMNSIVWSPVNIKIKIIPLLNLLINSGILGAIALLIFLLIVMKNGTLPIQTYHQLEHLILG